MSKSAFAVFPNTTVATPISFAAADKRIPALCCLIMVNKCSFKLRDFGTEISGLAFRTVSWRLASLSFKNGVVNQIDVIDAGTQLSNSKLSYYQAIVEYLNAKADLEELLEKK